MVLGLAVCEIHIPDIHGMTASSSFHIYNHYIVIADCTLDEFYSNEYLRIVHQLKRSWKEFCSVYGGVTHPTISNIGRIISKPNYIKLDIVDMRRLDGGEMIACIKTKGLRVLQRRYKAIYEQKQRKFVFYSLPKSLRYRQVNGKWPKHAV
jgi:hypothetical protein